VGLACKVHHVFLRDREGKRLEYKIRIKIIFPTSGTQAAKDDVWPDGTRVKGGTFCIILSYSMGRSEKM